jgi:hypothetical protein
MYIDPNTGGVIFGWLLGAFGLITGLLLIFSGRIRGAIARMRRKANHKDETEDQE